MIVYTVRRLLLGIRSATSTVHYAQISSVLAILTLSLLQANPQLPFFQSFHTGIYALGMNFYGDLITK